MTRRVLVAGVGNVFLGDDGFGVEVAARLAGEPLPDGVRVADFGIRGVHLAYELLDGYDLLVLVDAAPRGEPPGTLSLLEVDPDGQGAQALAAAAQEGESPLVDAHGLEPASVLALLGVLGGRVGRTLVVACEPADTSEGMGLSPPVSAAVDGAVAMVRELVEHDGPGPAPAGPGEGPQTTARR
jgi:hydrogenase maturation protease